MPALRASKHTALAGSSPTTPEARCASARRKLAALRACPPYIATPPCCLCPAAAPAGEEVLVDLLRLRSVTAPPRTGRRVRALPRSSRCLALTRAAARLLAPAPPPWPHARPSPLPASPRGLRRAGRASSLPVHAVLARAQAALARALAQQLARTPRRPCCSSRACSPSSATLPSAATRAHAAPRREPGVYVVFGRGSKQRQASSRCRVGEVQGRGEVGCHARCATWHRRKARRTAAPHATGGCQRGPTHRVPREEA